MKKTLCGLLIVMAVFMSVLTACSKQGGGASSGGTTNITFMGWEASPLETEAVKNGIAAFEQANPDIKVTYTPAAGGDAYTAKVVAGIASNSLPDVFFTGSATYRGFVARGALLDITDRFNEKFPLEDFINSSRTIMQVDGRVYGISSCNVSPIIIYNKKVFDDAGEPYPSSDLSDVWTIEEFREVAKRLTKDGVFGAFGFEELTGMMPPLIMSAGGSVYTPDYTLSAMNSAATRRVWQFVKDMRVIDKSMPSNSVVAADANSAGAGGITPNQMLATGKLGMLLGGSWHIQHLTTLGFDVGIAPLPSFGKVLTVGQAHLHTIAKNSKNPDASWRYLTFLAGMEYQGQLCKEGLWLPNRLSMWEDGPNGIDGWYDEERLGPYYRDMRAYFRDVEPDPLALQLTNRYWDIVREEGQRFFQLDAPIDECLANIDRRTVEEYEAYKRSR